jgi:UDP-glucose 4-epimerase
VNILITGGSGYLGSRLGMDLVGRGYGVRFATRSGLTFNFNSKNAEIFKIDWSSNESIKNACRGMDTILHLAGMDADSSLKNPSEAMAVNANKTHQLVTAAAQENVAKFIYFSTAHVYGSKLSGIVSEEVATSPVSPYAISKRAGEDYLTAAIFNGLLEGYVVRISNAFGCPALKSSGFQKLLIGDLAVQSIRSAKIILKSDGGQTRDFVPISTILDMVLHLIHVPYNRKIDPIFNIGGEKSLTVLEMANHLRVRVENKLNKNISINIGTSKDKSSEKYVYSIDKIRSLGFQINQENFLSELDNLINYCINNYEG